MLYRGEEGALHVSGKKYQFSSVSGISCNLSFTEHLKYSIPESGYPGDIACSSWLITPTQTKGKKQLLIYHWLIFQKQNIGTNSIFTCYTHSGCRKIAVYGEFWKCLAKGFWFAGSCTHGLAYMFSFDNVLHLKYQFINEWLRGKRS